MAIGDVITASVPRPALLAPLRAALRGVGTDELAAAGAVVTGLRPASVLGPARLFYPPSDFTPVAVECSIEARAEVVRLFAGVPVADLAESGLEDIDSDAFVSCTPDGAVACACGYRRWPNRVAHLSVLTHPRQRRLGHGRRAATAAVSAAVAEGLLPQWRARPLASQLLAEAVGLVPMGTQVSIQLA